MIIEEIVGEWAASQLRTQVALSPWDHAVETSLTLLDTPTMLCGHPHNQYLCAGCQHPCCAGCAEDLDCIALDHGMNVVCCSPSCAAAVDDAIPCGQCDQLRGRCAC